MPVQYKDFDKDTKDLLNKFYGTAWKIENKFKGPKDTFFINPQAENGKPLSVDVEYECSKTGLKLKTNVDPDLVIKPKVTYEHGGNKVEVSTLGDVRELNYEVNYELKEKGYAGSAKVTKGAIEASAVISVAHHCVVGAGVTHSLNGKPLSYSVATRYNAKGTILTLSTAAFKSFSVGALKGLKVANRDVTVATQVNYGGDKVSVTAGAEFACLLCPESQTVKIRANNALEVGVAIIRKFGDSWKAALSWQCKPECKNCAVFGLQLTHEPK